MKKIGAYKNRGALVMVLALSFQLLTGTGFFCATQYPNASLSLGDNRTTMAGTLADHGDVSTSARNSADGQGRKLPCSCKDRNQCLPIPRVALILNPAQEFEEVQRKSRALVCDSFVPDVLVLSLASNGAPPFTDLIGRTTPSSPPPLRITSVLLI